MKQAKPGQTVQFHRLTDNAHLNGKRGKLEHHHKDINRWSVRCQDGVVNAKIENLTVIDDDNDSNATSGNTTAADSSKWKIEETPQDTSLVPTLAVTLWLGMNGIIILIFLYGAFVAKKWERMVILGCCCASLILPADWGKEFGLGRWMMTEAEKYFGLKTIIEDEQNLLSHSSQNKAVIFAFNPHDILPYAVFAFSPFLRRLPGKLNDDGACLMTSAIFNIPFMRQVYSWTSALPVDKRTFLGRLNRGESFAFVPGGVQEVIMLDPNRPEDVVLFLKNRKGFVKLALSTGSPIVPVFGFNLDGSYGYWFPRHPYIEKLARSIGFLPLVFWGRWFVPFGIPRPKRISVVIGPAIDVPKLGEEMHQDVIDKYHGIFLKELEALFERHKHEAGYGERKLKIV